MSSLTDSFSGLARGAAVIFVGTLLGRALSLLGEVIIIRSLSPGAFGTVALAYTIVMTLSRIGLLGVPDGVSRMLSEDIDDSKQRDFVKNGYVIVLVSGSLIAIGLAAFRHRVADLMDESLLAKLVLLFIPFILLFALSKVTIAVLRARKRALGAALSRDFGPRIGAISTFLLFAYLGRPFEGAIVYWVISPAFATLLALWFVGRGGVIGSSAARLPDLKTLRELWTFSWPLAIRVSLVALMTNLDVLMIGVFLESPEVGFYRSVQPLRQVTHFVLQSFVFLFLPLATEYYSRDEFDNLRGLYQVSSKWIAVLTLPPVLVFSLFPQDIVRTILRPEYLPGSTALAVLTAGLFFNALVGPNGAMLKAVNRPRVEMYAAGLGLAVNLLLNVLLIPVLGIVGAAVATVVGYVMFNLVEVVVIYRLVGTHPFSANSLQPLTVTALVGIGVALFVGKSRLGFLSLVGIGILLVVVQAGAVWGTRSFDETDRVLIEQTKRRLGFD